MKKKNYFVFDSFKKNEVGIWYFVPNNIEDYKKKKPCYGFGCIKYLEGSVYTGELYFDGLNYNKIGFGQQEFTYSGLGDVDPLINEKKYLYVGEYNYKKTNWIYGNGVLYYRDLNGNPSRFVKGFFAGLDKIGEYQGEFDYSKLVKGYTKEMESNYSPRRALFNYELENLNKIERLDNLFIGDSYFEFWYYNQYAGKSFKNYFDERYNLNLGLGGSRFVDWFEYIELLKVLPPVKRIFINLGFNDLHSNFSPNKVYKDFLKTLNDIRNIFPKTEIYLLNVVHSPAFPTYYKKEVKLNEILNKNAKENNIIILDNNSKIKAKNYKISCFHEDLIHLNEIGYIEMYNLIKEVIK